MLKRSYIKEAGDESMEDDRCWLLTMLVEGQDVQSDLGPLALP